MTIPHAPLTPEVLPLLEAGDWLLYVGGGIGTFERVSFPTVRYQIDGTGYFDDYSRFTFLGKPRPDLGEGWIDWSGGENVLGDRRVEVLLRDGGTHSSPANLLTWAHECAEHGNGGDIIAFRILNEADLPSPDSGKGGAQVLKGIGNEGWTASTDQYDFTPATVEEAMAALATPPASEAAERGDLREAIARVIRQSGIDRGWAQEGDAEKVADAILALRPTPPEAVAWRSHDGNPRSPVDGSPDLFDFIMANGVQHNGQRAPRFWHLVSLWRPHATAPSRERELEGARKIVGQIAHIAATVGWQAGEAGSDIAGGIVSWLAAHPDQTTRFMSEGCDMFVNGEIDAHDGLLTWRAANGKMMDRESYAAARALTPKAGG